MQRQLKPRVNRRQWLAMAGAGAALLPATNLWLPLAQAADDLEPLNRFPRMVHEAFVNRVRQIQRRRLERLASLQNRADAEQYVHEVREKIERCFGPMPERTPLNPRVTGVVERDTYNIEKVIFESRPKFLVTANFYVPKNREGRVPGVVGTCGHSANGKAAEPYQAFAQGLARQGYAVLIFDPIGQGERLQSVDEKWQPKIGTGTREHLHFGNQQFLIGDFFGTWRAWDGIRALDYLLTRDEVDPQHVGVTGNSGGGTMTTWLSGVESRWTMSAPSCFVTTLLHNLENELPADTEQCPPGVLAAGLDHEDFLAALAPKPVIILAKEKDYFDVRGSEEAFQRLRRLYKLLGAEENVAMFFGDSYHGYTQENREAMYGFFNRLTEVSDTSSEPELVIEKDETLWCTPHGQVAELKPSTVFSFTSQKSKRLAKQREKRSEKDLRALVRRTLKLPPETTEPPHFRILRPLTSRNYPRPHALTYVVETEPNVQAIVTWLYEERHYSRPSRGSKAILYVAHQSSDDELRNEPLVKELLEDQPDATFLACDVRGIGESRPDTCGINSFRDPYGSDYFYAIHSLMLNRPYVGQKTHDVLRVLAFLADYGYQDVHLVGKGWGTLPATFAALLDKRVTRVTLKNAMKSYANIAETEDYRWPLSSLLPSVLRHFDLPDCYQQLAGKHLRQIDPWDAQMGEA